MSKLPLNSFLLIIGINFTAFAQKSQLQIAQNSVGKLQVSVANNEDASNQLKIIGEGIKAIESAQEDKKTKNWPETWAIQAYLSSYIALIDDNSQNADKHFIVAKKALDKAISLDKFQDNSGLIKAAANNINIKKQSEGNKAFQQNDFLTAFNLLKEVSDFIPSDTTTSINAALCAQNMLAYNDALKYYLRGKDNGIRNPIVFQNIASIYKSKFEHELAIKTLEDGLKLNPSHPFLTNDYINLLLDNEKYDKALKVIEGSLSTDKNNKLLLFLYGYLQQLKTNDNAAELAYKKALSVDQDYFSALYQLSLVYISKSNEALKENNKENFNSLLNRAEFSLLRAYEINPNDRNTLQLLIEIYSRKNKQDKVQELKQKLNEF